MQRRQPRRGAEEQKLMGRMQRVKGKEGEREVVRLLTPALPGVRVRRTGQDQAHRVEDGEGKPSDVSTEGILGSEVKRRKRMSWTAIREGVQQAVLSAARSSGFAVCWHREDRGEWMVTMPAEDFTELLREWHELKER